LRFGLLGTELWSLKGAQLIAKGLRRLRTRGAFEFGAELLSSSRNWLSSNFSSPKVHGLLAPWVLHTGLGPDNATSGFMNKLIAVALQLGGMPVPKGGGARLADALVKLVEAAAPGPLHPCDLLFRIRPLGGASPESLVPGETICRRRYLRNLLPARL